MENLFIKVANNPKIHLSNDPFFRCGAERDRTAGLHVANVALSQLSYCPLVKQKAKGKQKKENSKSENKKLKKLLFNLALPNFLKELLEHQL